MALDVHLTKVGEEPRDPPLMWFERSVHGEIFFGPTIMSCDYPQLQRMRDYYEDAAYAGDGLYELILELDNVIPKFSQYPEVSQTLAKFLTLCQKAEQDGKVVFLLAD